MGAVEIRIDKDGALKVVQRYDLRPVLRRMLPEGFERHRVSAWPTCSVQRPDSCCRGGQAAEEAKFNRALKIVFIIVLCLCVASLVLTESLLRHGNFSWNNKAILMWLSGCFVVGPTGILILAMFAVVLTVGVLAKNVTKKARSAPPRREEVQTVSALVQQV